MPELVSERSERLALPGTSPTHESDALLMRAVARGDQRAFERVYEAHRARVYRLAYGVLLDRDEAREAVQEAFSRLFLVASRWEPHAALGTWLHRVVLNHCLSLRKRLFRFGKSERRANAEPSPELAATLGQAVGIVERNLESLAPRVRAIVTLHLDGELKPAEIALLVDMTPNAVRVALHRALERLRRELEDAGIDASAAEERFEYAAEEET